MGEEVERSPSLRNTTTAPHDSGAARLPQYKFVVVNYKPENDRLSDLHFGELLASITNDTIIANRGKIGSWTQREL